MPEDKVLKQAAPGLIAEASSSTSSPRDTRDNPVQNKTADLRGSPRHIISASADAVEPRSRNRLTCRATDLSLGGCYLDTLNPFEPGTVVYLQLVSEDRVFQTEARVRYSTPGMGMGLAFTKLTPENMETLSQWLRVLGREIAPPELPADPVFDFGEPAKPGTPADGVRDVVAVLVALLARKDILTASEAEELQKRLARKGG